MLLFRFRLHVWLKHISQVNLCETFHILSQEETKKLLFFIARHAAMLIQFRLKIMVSNILTNAENVSVIFVSLFLSIRLISPVANP